MTFDAVISAKDEEKWLEFCVSALAAQNYPLEKISVYITDSTKGKNDCCGVTKIEAAAAEMKKRYTGFKSFEYKKNKKGIKAGKALNIGAENGKGDYILFLSPGVAPFSDMLTELEKFIKAHPDGGAFECRQLPFESDKHYDPVTLKASFFDISAVAVKRDIFEKVKGFDKKLGELCAGADLAWRIRACEKAVYYVPFAKVMQAEKQADQTLEQYAERLLDELLLKYKYLGFIGRIKGEKKYIAEMKAPQHYNGVRKVLLKGWLSHFAKLWHFLFWRNGAYPNRKSVPYRFENGFDARRGEYEWQPQDRKPFISVIVRTCNRADILQKTLQSLRNQTYDNFEIIVAEDGEPTAEKMIKDEFSDLPIRYICTGKLQGRGKNGNGGIAAANGEYCNFLDDDDYFYPEHLELMAQAAAKNPEADLILGCAMAMTAEILSRSPYEIKPKKIFPMRFDRVDLFSMCQSCRIPIQSAMFKKSLFEKCGGLDERLEGDEDWAMWMKYLANGIRTDKKAIDIPRATSIFVQPADEKAAQARLENYRRYDEAFFNSPEMNFNVTLAEMRGYYNDVLKDIAHLQRIGKLDEFLRKNIKR